MFDRTWKTWRANNLVGDLPVEIADLTQLTILNVEDNVLAGNPTQQIERLTNLQELNLGMNRFETFPSMLGGLTNLVSFRMPSNDVGVAAPVDIITLTNLRELDISGNRIAGNMPPFGNLVNLESK